MKVVLLPEPNFSSNMKFAEKMLLDSQVEVFKRKQEKVGIN